MIREGFLLIMKQALIAPPVRGAQLVIIAALLTIFAACSSLSVASTTGGTTTTTIATPTPGGTAPTGGTTPTAAPCVGDCTAGTGLSGGTLITEPTAGDTPIVQAIGGAQHSVQLEIYLLTETNVIHALEDAANRGINVQVMLEGHPYGSGPVSPQQTIATLNAAGVHAQEADSHYALTHAKILIIDTQTVFISSGNFTKTSLGGSSYGADRDYMIVDTNAADVQACGTIFAADWANTATTPALADPQLVVSPVNARSKLLALIGGAKQTLHLEEEEMQDPQFIQALTSTAGHGVNVEVVLPASSSNDQGAQQLAQGGVHVARVQDSHGGNPYIHAKIIIADGTLAYVGSVNASTQSMDQNREIGVLVASQQLIQQLDGTFTQDYASGNGG